MQAPKENDRKPAEKENVDKTIEDTFPASDPPSWSGSTATGDEPKE